MAEKTSRASLKKDSVNTEINKIETLSNKYIDQAADTKEKEKRKKIMVSALSRFAVDLEKRSSCSRGFHWDPISMTCVPD
jgi:hypothetical protein